MPYGIFPIPQYPITPASPSRPSLWLRLKTWWQRDRLDEQLARGADRQASDEMELRSMQLVDRAGRTELAHSLEGVVQHARYAPALGDVQVRGTPRSRGAPTTCSPSPTACATASRSTSGERPWSPGYFTEQARCTRAMSFRCGTPSARRASRSTHSRTPRRLSLPPHSSQAQDETRQPTPRHACDLLERFVSRHAIAAPSV